MIWLPMYCMAILAAILLSSHLGIFKYQPPNKFLIYLIKIHDPENISLDNEIIFLSVLESIIWQFLYFDDHFGQRFCILKAPNPQINLYPIKLNSLDLKTYLQVPNSFFYLLKKPRYDYFCVLAVMMAAIWNYLKTTMLVHLRNNADLVSAVIFTLK